MLGTPTKTPRRSAGSMAISRSTNAWAMPLIKNFTPLVERISIDAAFADVACCTDLFGPPLELANAIRRRVRAELAFRLVKTSRGAKRPLNTGQVVGRRAKAAFACNFVGVRRCCHVLNANPGAVEERNLLGVPTSGLLADHKRSPFGMRFPLCHRPGPDGVIEIAHEDSLFEHVHNDRRGSHKRGRNFTLGRIVCPDRSHECPWIAGP